MTADKISQLVAYLDELADGHAILRETYAQEICKAFAVPYSDKLVHSHTGDPGRGDSWSGEMKGVWDLNLIAYLADKLNVGPVQHYLGRGFQAQAYARAIREKLEGVPATRPWKEEK
jgi:hypothetical protein